MQACELAVESTDSFILSHACATINNICTFVAQETEKNEIHKSLNGSNNEDSTSNDQQRRRSSSSKQAPATHWLMTYLTQFPNILPSLLVTILNLVLFDDTQDQWTLSRPLYVLMLLQKQVEYLFFILYLKPKRVLDVCFTFLFPLILPPLHSPQYFSSP